MSSIKLSGVTKHYGDIAAVRDVTLQVENGELLTILGPSGVGKTTILMLIAGFEQPTSGSVLIAGTDVTHQPVHERGVGLVFQSHALFPHMTVFANVAFPLVVRRRPKAEIAVRVAKALELVELAGFEDRRPATLSGGQQQRVALARALVFEPHILLLDEPLAALDRKLRQQMQVELRELQRSLGITTILVTHDQEEALTMSDRIAVLCDGQIAQLGSPEDLYRRPRSRFVAESLGRGNFLEARSSSSGAETHPLLDDGRDVVLTDGAAADEKDRAWLLLRPHQTLLSRSDDETGLLATVTAAVYRGSSALYQVITISGKKLIATEPLGPMRLHVGDQVKVTWSADDAHLIGRDDGEEVVARAPGRKPTETGAPSEGSTAVRDIGENFRTFTWSLICSIGRMSRRPRVRAQSRTGGPQQQ